MGSILEKIDESHEKLLKKHFPNSKEDSKGNLYHYTSVSSALNILKTGKLRLTDFRYLNDPLELKHALKIIHSALLKINEIKELNLEIKTKLAAFYNTIAPQLDFRDDLLLKNPFDFPLLSKKRKTLSMPIFLFSLSEKGDDLRQWMPYANNGAGVAIGFNGCKNRQHKIADVDMVSCNYNIEKTKIEYAYDIFRDLVELYKNPNSVEKHMGEFIIQNFIDCIASKDPAFIDEDEWRLFKMILSKNLEQLNFYEKNNVIKPYIEIDFYKDSLVEIVLGPKCDPLNEESFNTLCSKFDYKFEVKKSIVPYR